MEHFIKNIEITNFKSIRHAEIKDCRRVNVFIGYPNVGKSNILEALSIFSLIDSGRLKDLVRLTKDTTIFFDGMINQDFKIKIDNDFCVTGKYFQEKLIIEFYVLNNNRLSQSLKAWVELLNGLPFRFKRLTLENFEVKEREDFTTDNPKYYLNPNIKKYDFKKDIVFKEGNPQDLDFPFGNNIYSVLKNSISLRKDFNEIAKSYNLDLLFSSTSQTLSLLKRTEAGIFEVPWELIADTLQRLFFYKTVIESNKSQKLLLEEPESHMFPPYISKMTGDIIYDENNNQFFIATHSPYVLGDLIRDVEPDELSVYIVDYDIAKGETIIHRMNEEEVSEAYQFGHDFFMNINNFIPNTQHEQV